MIVGWKVHNRECNTLSSLLVTESALVEGINEHDLVLHSDNGGPMKGSVMLATLQKLGIAASFSRPSVSNDNPFSEALFRTLKYRPEYPAIAFSNISEACAWVESFVNWYNNKHFHSGIKFVAPISKHYGLDIRILKKRKEVYLKAKTIHPERWSKEIRNWDPVQIVRLNPQKGSLN